ncbi:hypothetical protein BKA59DRAFT_474921 [Fusarium tricinctum]|uniref:Uncharacterized protein n=1 Tax=Fusarium tricinctum TaxID=61284 RepID=A0A8K0S3J4_9HYPO|nr:hypothetical protein BKA59DRAFT_474921 [Fusarium tricinctum]
MEFCFFLVVYLLHQSSEACHRLRVDKHSDETMNITEPPMKPTEFADLLLQMSHAFWTHHYYPHILHTLWFKVQLKFNTRHISSDTAPFEAFVSQDEPFGTRRDLTNLSYVAIYRTSTNSQCKEMERKPRPSQTTRFPMT